ncbi:MAG: adenylyltransferase/cytidyltransferase family protein [Erysipelotrichaceae bacterium]|nr:adenylyltransferase/cytidyltransferase family protein [Erysipelotrichaceae bacterium]
MRIGIYTGSFDPIHNGHIKIVRTILKEKLVDRVFIFPSGDYWDKKVNLTCEERADLISYAFKYRIAKDRYEVDSELGKLPYTYLLFRELKKRYPDDEFFYILGGDNILKFTEWQNYEELLQNGFIIVDRNIDDLEERLRQLGPKSYVIVPVEGISDISSTYIRENMDDYEKIKKMISRREYEYILALKRK